MLYLDYYTKGSNYWKRIQEDQIPDTEEEKFVTWQRYISKERGEEGAEYGNFVADFDDNLNPENARLDAVKFYDKLIDIGVNPVNINIFFSGKKGFHVELDYRAYMEKPEHKLHLIYKTYYIANKEHLKTLDKSMYSSRRQWRVVNTKHSGSGLFCVQISREELGESLDNIKGYAKEPRALNNHFVKDEKLKLIYENMQSEYYKSVDEFKKRQINISNINIKGIPPCITGALNQRGLTTMRNEILFKNACDLRAINKTIEEATELIEPFVVGNNYDRSSAKSSLISAFKKERYLSCIENKEFCDKDVCNSMMDKDEGLEIYEFNKRFGIRTQEEVIAEVKEDIRTGEYLPVIQSGLKHIDNKCPILKDHLLVICGNSNEGKTSFLVTIIKNNPDKKCLFWSIEEGYKRASLRLNYAEYFRDNVKHIVCYDSEPITEKDIKMSIKVYKPDYIVIDQLINMEQSKNIKKEERLKYKFLMENLRRIARDSNIPILLSHQLNREAIGEDVPIKEQIAEGADIERLAYDVWILFRRKINGTYYNFVNIAKTKQFQSNVVIPVTFNPNTFTLSSYEGEILREMTDKYNVSKEIMDSSCRDIIIKKQRNYDDVPWTD